VQVIIDAKTLMSESNVTGDEEWNSLDELKASYIAGIQTDDTLGKPQKITMDGKEIWKVPVNTIADVSGKDAVKYIYVDLATGKSKNTLDSFNKAAGTDGWLTLKEVDDVINSGNYQSNYLTDLKPTEKNPFKDVLRDLYPE
jgi:hypothetical protein